MAYRIIILTTLANLGSVFSIGTMYADEVGYAVHPNTVQIRSIPPVFRVNAVGAGFISARVAPQARSLVGAECISARLACYAALKNRLHSPSLNGIAVNPAPCTPSSHLTDEVGHEVNPAPCTPSSHLTDEVGHEVHPAPSRQSPHSPNRSSVEQQGEIEEI